jgi:hypothetical protein
MGWSKVKRGLSAAGNGFVKYATPYGHYNLIKDKWFRGSAPTSKKGVVNIVAELVSTSFVRLNTECFSSTDASQQITIKCSPPDTAWPEESAACRADIEFATDQMMRDHEIERRMWTRGGAARVRKPVADEIVALRTRMTGSNCKACEFNDVSQFNVISTKQSCSISAETMAKWQATIKQNIEAMAFSRGDVLAGMMAAFSTPTKRDAVTNFSNRIARVDLKSVETALYAQLISRQTMEFTGQSTSFKGVTQRQAIETSARLIVDTGFYDEIMTAQEWETFQRVTEENTTLDDAGNVIAQIVTSVVGGVTATFQYVVITAAAILLLLILVLVGYTIKAKQKSKT